MVAVYNNIKILGSTANGGLQIEAALGGLEPECCRLIQCLSERESVLCIANSTVKEYVVLLINKTDVVILACLGSCCNLNGNNCGLSSNGYVEFLVLRYVTVSDGCRNLNRCFIILRCCNKLTVNDSDRTVVIGNCPSDDYLCKGRARERKLNGAACGCKACLDRKIVLFSCYLISIGNRCNVDHGCKVSNKLRRTDNRGVIDVLYFGRAYSSVAIISTEVVGLLLAADSNGGRKSASFSIVLVGVGARSCIRNVLISVNVTYGNVSLTCAAYHIVEVILAILAINSLKIYVNCLLGVGRGFEITVFVDGADEVKRLLCVLLLQHELVCCTNHGGGNNVTYDRGSRIDSNLKVLSGGCLTAFKSCGKSDLLRFIGKHGNCELITRKGCILCGCERPRDNYVAVKQGSCVKSNCACFGDITDSSHELLLILNLLLGCSFNNREICECIDCYGNDVYLIVVDRYKTCNGCTLTDVIGNVFLKRSRISCAEHVGRA